MKFKSLFTAVLAGMLAMPFAVQAQTYNVAVGDPKGSDQASVATAFEKHVEEMSNGRIKIEVFYGSALGDETETLRNVQNGTLAFAVAGIANVVPFQKKLGILTLPYLWNSLDEAVKGTTGKPAELINSYAVQSGLRILGYSYTDFRFITNSRKPITKMEDMKDLKFRVPQSAVLIASYKAFGASPTPISWSETFTALQQGVVDGQRNGYLTYQTMKFGEANQKYLTEVHYTYHIQSLVMSERVFRKLSKEDQELFVEAGRKAQQDALDFHIKYTQQAKEQLIKEGLVVSYLEDEEKWKEAALTKVWPEMEDFVGGKEAINEYLKAMGKPEWNN